MISKAINEYNFIANGQSIITKSDTKIEMPMHSNELCGYLHKTTNVQTSKIQGLIISYILFQCVEHAYQKSSCYAGSICRGSRQ
jgi:hypothetical protein